MTRKSAIAVMVGFFLLSTTFSSIAVAYETDYRAKIYSTGSSISNGSPDHDSIHNGASDDIEHQYQYWVDQYMAGYGIQTNMSDWYQNVSYASSWDKYSIGTGGGQTNPDNDGCDGAGSGDTGAYPYCCHCPPTRNSDAEDAFYMACVPAQLDGVYGRQVWRYKNKDWSDIDYFIVECGINEASDYNYYFDAGYTEAQFIQYLRSNIYTGLYGAYNRSQTYGFTLTILKTIPTGAWVPQAYIDAVNEEKESFASTFTDTLLIDTFNTSMVIWTVPYTTWVYNSGYFADSAHPNKAGYQVMANVIAEALYNHMVNATEEEEEIPPLQINDIGGSQNGSGIITSTPTLNWSKANDASMYHIQFATDTDFNNLIVNLSNVSKLFFPNHYSENSTHVSFQLPEKYELPDYGRYYFRVRAYAKVS